MSPVLDAAIGLVLGALGGALHLAITRWRAALAAARGPAAALAAMPLGLFALGALVFAAARLSPLAAWAAPAGIFAVRFAVLRRLGR